MWLFFVEISLKKIYILIKAVNLGYAILTGLILDSSNINLKKIFLLPTCLKKTDPTNVLAFENATFMAFLGRL